MIRHNFCLFILISTVLVDASVLRQAKTDDICGRITGVLCINDTLALIVATAVGSIEPIAKAIENEIISGSDTDTKYQQLVDKKIALMQIHLPSSYYHAQFVQMANIDQVGLNLTSFVMELISFLLEILGSFN